MSKWLLMLIGCIGSCFAANAADEQTLYIVGSTTVSGVAKATAEAFQRKTGIKLVVRPIGTSKGIGAIAEGVADIGMASRYLDGRDFEKWPFIKQVTIGQDALAIIINRANPIANLTVEQLRGIYSGEIRDWQKLAGAAALSAGGTDIGIYSKNIGHGTFDAFVSLVGLDAMNDPRERKIYFKRKGENRLFNKSGAAIYEQANQAVATVQRLPNAIAYDSLGAMSELDGVRHASNVKIIMVDGVKATVENASTGLYPLVRPLNLLFNSENAPNKVHQYLDFVLSQEGQQIVLNHDYIPIR